MPDELDLPDSLFIPSDDVLQEAGDVPPVEAAASPEPRNTVPDQIPYNRFQEVVSEREQIKAENAQLRAMAMQMFGQLEQSKKQVPAQPEFDPDVDAMVGPMIEARISRHLAALMPTVQNLQAQNETQQAWNQLNQLVPDLNDLGPDIVAYIQTLPHARAAKILADPEDLADVAERVRMKRQLQSAGGTDTANRDLRSRSRGETPSGTRQASSSKDPYAELLNDDAKFNAYMRKSGLL